MKHFKSFLFFLILCQFSVMASEKQINANDLPKTDSIASKKVNFIEDTFFSSRVLNGHTTEGTPQSRFDLRIEHRFGQINTGYSTFFGLDQAFTFIGLEYGIKNWWMVGINRSSTDQTLAGFTQFSLVKQCSGFKNIPVSISLLLGSSFVGVHYTDTARNNDFNSRVSFTSQVLISRKFSNNFSAQLSPVWIHRNIVPSGNDNNDLFAMGISARYKITTNLSLNGEYYPVINPSTYFKQNYKNSLSFGLDIETEGHVFQIILSNSTDMIEKNFIGETKGDWQKGDIHLGFNILRKFDL